MDKRTADLYVKLNSFKYLVDKTNRFIAWSLRQVSNPYVACSFGKDSAVMLHLLLQHNSTIPVRFIRWRNETEFIDNYDEVIEKWININLTQVELSRDSLSDKRKDRFDVDNYDSYFIGLRQEESTSRRITLKTHGKFYRNKSDKIRISPLSEWTTKDISAYVLAYNLPTLNTYTKHGMNARTASRIPRADFGIRESFITDLKNRDINAYQQLVSKFPEIKIYG